MVVVLRSSDVFACAKTRKQPMYMDVHWLMRYLYPLFLKTSISEKQPENLFSKVLISFRPVNNIYIATENHLQSTNSCEWAFVDETAVHYHKLQACFLRLSNL